jgi:hypothetical protein
MSFYFDDLRLEYSYWLSFYFGLFLKSRNH